MDGGLALRTLLRLPPAPAAAGSQASRWRGPALPSSPLGMAFRFVRFFSFIDSFAPSADTYQATLGMAPLGGRCGYQGK